MKSHLKDRELQKEDQAWLVVDRDNWANMEIAKLHEWSMHRENFGFALSNPKFEY